MSAFAINGPQFGFEGEYCIAAIRRGAQGRNDRSDVRRAYGGTFEERLPRNKAKSIIAQVVRDNWRELPAG